MLGFIALNSSSEPGMYDKDKLPYFKFLQLQGRKNTCKCYSVWQVDKTLMAHKSLFILCAFFSSSNWSQWKIKEYRNIFIICALTFHLSSRQHISSRAMAEAGIRPDLPFCKTTNTRILSQAFQISEPLIFRTFHF